MGSTDYKSLILLPGDELSKSNQSLWTGTQQVYVSSMTTLEEIKKAIETLSLEEKEQLLAKLLVSLRKTEGELPPPRLYSPAEIAAMLAEDELTKSMIQEDVNWGLHGKG